MKVYLVTYDIKQGSGTHDYAELWAEFEKLDAEKILYSVYLVATASWNSADLNDHLRQFLDPADRLWVSRVTSDTTALWCLKGPTGWKITSRYRSRPPAVGATLIAKLNAQQLCQRR